MLLLSIPLLVGILYLGGLGLATLEQASKQTGATESLGALVCLGIPECRDTYIMGAQG